MILACPLCHARYLVSANVFASGPRQVRCARCSHSWQAELPKEIDAVMPPAVDLTPPSAAHAPLPPIPKGSGLPVVQKAPMPIWLKRSLQIGGLVFAAFFLLWIVLDRQSIAKKWPSMEPIYEKVGLIIYQYGEGLSFEQVRSELYFEGGMMKLGIEGKIQNGTPKMQLIPHILANAIGSDGHVMQSWQIDAPAAKVFPGERIKFQSSINAPQGTVAEVNLNFIEIKDDAAE